MKEDTGHLSDAQIEETASKGPGECSPSVEAHLSECDVCLDRLLTSQRTQFAFLESHGMRTEAYPDCPQPEVLQEIAAQAQIPESADPVLKHTAQCDYCGPLFNRYLQDFSDDYDPALRAMLQRLPSTQERQQKELARNLAAHARGEKDPSKPSTAVMPWPFWKKAVAWATPLAAVLLVAVGFGPTLMETVSLQTASKQIGSAFPQRPFELRLPGMNYVEYAAPITILGEEKRSRSNPDLMKAKISIAENSAKNGKLTWAWNELDGRAALMENPKNPGMAEDAFERAKSERGNTPELLIDLAVTHYVRESNSDSPNLSATIDLLNQALKNPQITGEQRSAALFDLAISYEKSNALDLAASTWNQYLQSDTDITGAWHKEAQQRFEALKKKLPAVKPADFKQPAYLIRHARDPDVQNDIEQYADFAMASWLVPGIREPSSDYGKALNIIAELMEQQHSDLWWKDFLQHTTAADLPAVETFSRAYVADLNDFHYQAMQDSRESAELFKKNRNLPGELIARFEEIYGLQRIVAAHSCLDSADRLTHSLEATHYSALQAKVHLELAICANLVSDDERRSAELEQSDRLARQYSLPEIHLRVEGMQASMDRLRNSSLAWQESVAGLHDYWKGPYSSERLYQFYAVMLGSARAQSRVNASEAFLRRNIEVLSTNAPEDIALRSSLHLSLANMLVEQNQDAQAEAEANQARRLLDQPRQDLTAQTYLVPARIDLVNLELKSGHNDLALLALDSVPSISDIQDDGIRIAYYGAAARAMFAAKRLTEASRNYDQGIAIASDALRRLDDDDVRLSLLNATSGLFRGKVEVLLAQKNPEEAFKEWEQAKLRLFRSTRADFPHASGEGRRTSFGGTRSETRLSNAPLFLNADKRGLSTRLVYAVFNDHVQIWVLQDGATTSISSPVRKDQLTAAISDFTRLASDDRSSLAEIDRKAEQLYSFLIAPASMAVDQAESLVIEADEPLAQLAMEAMKKPGGDYIGQSRSVVYSPGVLVDQLFGHHVQFQKGPVLAVDTSPTKGPAYLPGHAELDAAILQLHPDAIFLRGAFATHTAVLDALSKASSFFFFGHGRPNSTGIALEMGDGSKMRANEIRSGMLPATRIVVLAACSSGNAENGLMDSGSLVRSFLAAGVPAVVTSHWNVDSRSTAVFMQAFYKHLETESPEHALLSARQEMRAQHTSPFFWAAFNIAGQGI